MNEILSDLPQKADKQVKMLMKHIHDGISIFTLPELNRKLKNIIRKPQKSDNSEFVLDVVSSHFKMSKEELINSKSRGKGYSPKMIAFVLMHRVLGESIRDIADTFKRFHNAITHGIENFDNITESKTIDGKHLLEQYTKCEKKIINHLQSQELK